MKKILFTIFIYTFIYVPIYAEKNKLKQTNLWFRYKVDIKLPRNTKIYLETEDRLLVTPTIKNNIILWRVGAEKQFKNNWSIGGGIYNAYNGTNDAYNSSTLIIPEVRPFIDITYKQKINDIFNIYHRYRTEWRFIKNTNKAFTQREDGFTNNFRFRYHIGIALIPFKNETQELSLTLYNELFINAGKSIKRNIFDQNRLGLALRYNLTKTIGAEISYLYNIQQKSNGDDMYSRQILRFTIYNNFSIQKK